ncbi:hypothetical protein ACFY0A_45065 [Streptomyces sp. NPDC001698]|uniref:hypothetical protein n=1 Tax=unclassified Streptomyces TaxID=2593676 RepID=UPI0036B01687
MQTFAGNAAADFGNRRELRSTLATHLNRVDAAFIQAADRLASDRAAAARQLAELAALAANNIAAGRFTAVLPAEALAEEAPLEPDRLDGHRLATACLWAAAIVTASFVALSPLGEGQADIVLPGVTVHGMDIGKWLAKQRKPEVWTALADRGRHRGPTGRVDHEPEEPQDDAHGGQDRPCPRPGSSVSSSAAVMHLSTP